MFPAVAACLLTDTVQGSGYDLDSPNRRGTQLSETAFPPMFHCSLLDLSPQPWQLWYNAQNLDEAHFSRSTFIILAEILKQLKTACIGAGANWL